MKEKLKKLVQQIKNCLDKVNIQNGKKIKVITIIISVVVILIAFLSFNNAITSAKERQDELNYEVSDLKSLLSIRETEYDSLETENEELTLLKTEYKEYKNKMSPFEDLEESEAKAKTAEADAKKAELEKNEAEEKTKKEEERKAKESEEKAKKEAEAENKKREENEKQAQIEAEEAKGYETGTTFDQLARTPDDYEFTKVKFSGKVIQVMEGEGTTQIRFAVNDDYNSTIYAELSADLTKNNRVLEDDYITLSGFSMGLLSYKSTMGGEITVPSISVDKIER